jgi:hypothetical protein
VGNYLIKERKGPRGFGWLRLREFEKRDFKAGRNRDIVSIVLGIGMHYYKSCGEL